jgi:hypothetical protein
MEGREDSAREAKPDHSEAAAREQDKRAGVVVEGGERRAVRAERAVRHCGKFPNGPVAPLRAGRQCKPLRLREIRSFGQCPRL